MSVRSRWARACSSDQKKTAFLQKSSMMWGLLKRVQSMLGWNKSGSPSRALAWLCSSMSMWMGRSQ